MRSIGVTAYFDIGRGAWEHHTRSAQAYCEYFHPFVVRQVFDELHAFVDMSAKDAFEAMVGPRGLPEWIRVQYVDRDAFLTAHSRPWSKRAHVGAIMDTIRVEEGQENRPDVLYPDYIAVIWSKFDLMNLIRRTVNDSDAFYTWVDFGYFRSHDDVPLGRFDPRRTCTTRMNLLAANPVGPSDFDMVASHRLGHERLAAGLMSGPSSVIERVANHFWSTVCRVLDEGFMSSEERVLIRCLQEQPDLYCLWDMNGWIKSLRYYSDDVWDQREPLLYLKRPTMQYDHVPAICNLVPEAPLAAYWFHLWAQTYRNRGIGIYQLGIDGDAWRTWWARGPVPQGDQMGAWVAVCRPGETVDDVPPGLFGCLIRILPTGEATFTTADPCE